MISSVFLGTPGSSVAALEATLRVSDVRLVVTQPDRPRGRSKTPQPSAVKEAALGLGLPVAEPSDRLELLAAVAQAAPFDIGVVVAFGMILSPSVLAIPRAGFVNVHFSLLPRWRGAAPVERAILAGDERTGVTLMAVESGLDTGPVISSREVPIEPGETSEALLDRLTELGVALLEEDMPGYASGALISIPQREDGVTYARKIETVEAHIPVESQAGTALRWIRAFNPRPGAFGILDGERFKVWEAKLAPVSDLEPGELRIVGGRLCLGLGEGALELLEVQPAGGRRMAAMDWARGRHGPPEYLH